MMENDDWQTSLRSWCSVEHFQYDVFEDGLKFLMHVHFPTRDIYFRQDNADAIKDVIRSALPDAERQILDVTTAIKGKKRQTDSEKILMQRRHRVMEKIRYQFNQLAVKLYGTPLKLRDVPSTPTKSDEVVDGKEKSDPVIEECTLCFERDANVAGCPFPHMICHICYARIVFMEEGIFKCPSCKTCEIVVIQSEVPSAPPLPNEVPDYWSANVEEENANVENYRDAYNPASMTRAERLAERNRRRESSESNTADAESKTGDAIDVNVTNLDDEVVDDVFSMSDMSSSISEIEITNGKYQRMKPNERSIVDYYGTPPEVTRQAVAVLRKMYPNVKCIFEPCAGLGAIVNVLEDEGYDVMKRDLFFIVSILK